MDKFYEKWQGSKETSLKEMLSNTDGTTCDAVVLGNLNYQVENGGFYQWADNGYVLNLIETCNALIRINTENAKKVLKMLNAIYPHVNFEARSRGCFGEYWKVQDYDEEVECECWDADEDEYDEDCPDCNGSGYYYETVSESRAPEFLDSFDDEYYSINEQLMDEIELYFKNLLANS